MKLLFRIFIFIVFIMNHYWLKAAGDTLIYIGDPMCSWCYGFAPEITEVKEHYPGMEFRLVLGGLRPHGSETMATLGTFLGHHWDEVHKRSGQPFNHGILTDSNFVYNTEPACRAVVVARKLKPEVELAFFKAVQRAFYVHNQNTADPLTYAGLAEEFGMDTETFITHFNAEETRQECLEDFRLTAAMGIQGFPAVVIKHKGQFFLAANGYTSAENLIRTIDRILAE